jgi:hypothetical protein
MPNPVLSPTLPWSQGRKTFGVGCKWRLAPTFQTSSIDEVTELNRRIIRMNWSAPRLLVEGLTPLLEFCGDDECIRPCYDAALAVAGVET